MDGSNEASLACDADWAETDWPPAAGGFCVVCRRWRRPGRMCQVPERIYEVFRRRRWKRRPPREQCGVCKDCCIAQLGGHGCAWWKLCWLV